MRSHALSAPCGHRTITDSVSSAAIKRSKEARSSGDAQAVAPQAGLHPPRLHLRQPAGHLTLSGVADFTSNA